MPTPTWLEVGGPAGSPRVRSASGALCVRRLRGTDSAGGTTRGAVRIALVAAQALLLAGDEVAIEVEVDGPHRVEIVETGGTVAYDMRGGGASWDVSIRLRRGACLSWHGRPFVVARGAEVDRSTEIALDEDSRLALRETIVLGRSGEVGGSLRTRLRVERGGTPLVAEDLDLAPDARAGLAVLGGHRCLDGVLLTGARLPDGPAVLQSEGPASMSRWLGDDLHRSDQEQRWTQAHDLADRGDTQDRPVPA